MAVTVCAPVVFAVLGVLLMVCSAGRVPGPGNGPWHVRPQKLADPLQLLLPLRSRHARWRSCITLCILQVDAAEKHNLSTASLQLAAHRAQKLAPLRYCFLVRALNLAASSRETKLFAFA